ncbi:hypothetical protein GJ496_001544 [Pomphorhynchus laevis]|nr:hypothetical protein GJ496_001544 [Pomphorhynchus laevis]
MGNSGAFTKSYRENISDIMLTYHSVYLLLSIMGMCVHEFFYSLLLLDVVHREDTLWNVIQCVIRNAKSVILTALLAVIIIYLFAICGYIFLKDDFILDVSPKGQTEIVSSDDSVSERVCDSLITCIVTTLNKGLRNGGGIGDVLREPSIKEPLFYFRVVYDLMFFFIVIIVTLNLIFGVIIDNFADIREEKQRNEETLRNTCFICGLDRRSFDNKETTFDEHIQRVHNMWHYIQFMVLIKVKDPTEFTGPESYVHEMIEKENLNWFPRMRTIALDSKENKKEDEDNRALRSQLYDVHKLIDTLNETVNDIKKHMYTHKSTRPRFNIMPSVGITSHPHPMLNSYYETQSNNRSKHINNDQLSNLLVISNSLQNANNCFKCSDKNIECKTTSNCANNSAINRVVRPDKRKLSSSNYDWNDDNQSKKCIQLRGLIDTNLLLSIHGSLPPSVDTVNRCVRNNEHAISVQRNLARNQNYVKGTTDIFLPENAKEFDRFVRKNNGKPIVIDFYAKWLSEAIKREKGKIKVIRVNVSKLPRVADRFDVKLTPTAISFGCDGKILDKRLSGAISKSDVDRFVNEIMDTCRDKKKVRSASESRWKSNWLKDEENEKAKMLLLPKFDKDKLYRGNSVSGYSVEPSLTDDFPQPNQLQTYKQYIFTNDSIALKPISVIPGIGQVYSERMRNHDIIYARQLVGIYMQIGNIPKFQHWLKEKFGMNERWSITTAEALAEVVRHLC